MSGNPLLGSLGRILILVGLVSVLAGGLLLLAARVPGWGRLPGDIVIHRGRLTLILPVATCILVSLLLTLIVNLFLRR